MYLQQPLVWIVSRGKLTDFPTLMEIKTVRVYVPDVFRNNETLNPPKYPPLAGYGTILPVHNYVHVSLNMEIQVGMKHTRLL